MELVLASGNLHKAEEIRKILGNKFHIELMDKNIEIIEDGETFRENAVKKALYVANHMKKPVIADDSGLMVDFLGGNPGVKTARFAGESASDEQNIDKLLHLMKGVPYYKRTAKFICVIALVIPHDDFKISTFFGECDGIITTERMGESGFGYDPVFFVPKFACTMAQLEPHIKNAISHRSQALLNFMEEYI